MRNIVYLAAGAIFAVMVAAGPALAQSTGQTSGTTSGPAAGSNVEPGAATQKHAGNKPSVAAGSPGVAAKKGSESGAKPKNGAPQQR